MIYNEIYEIRKEKDWSELPEFQHVLNEFKSTGESSMNSNTSNDSILVYNVERIEAWYLQRAIEIENLTDLIDVALTFAEFAITNGCRNLTSLVEDLRTLHTIVYECGKQNNGSSQSVDDYYNLEFIGRLKRLDRLCLIMDRAYESTNELYVKNLKEWLIPYIGRCQTLAERNSLLRDFLLKVSKSDLNVAYKLFKLKVSGPVIPQLNELNLVSILLDCFFVSEVPQQVDICAQLIHEIVNTTEPSRVGPLNMEILEKIKNIQDYLKVTLIKFANTIKYEKFDNCICHE